MSVLPYCYRCGNALCIGSASKELADHQHDVLEPRMRVALARALDEAFPPDEEATP